MDLEEKITQNIDNITDSLADSMPDVQPHVIEKEAQKQDAIKQQFTGLVDNDGNPFDPILHATDKDGEPKLTKAGKLQKKRGNAQQQAKSIIAQRKHVEEKAKSEQSRKGAALAATAMTEQLGVILGGEAARFAKNEKYGLDEKHNVFSAYDSYFEAKNINDFPPGVALCIALSGYGVRVMSTKPAKDKSKSIWYGIKAKIGAMFTSKPKGNKKDDTRAVSGDNTKRENDAGQAHSGKIQVKGD